MGGTPHIHGEQSVSLLILGQTIQVDCTDAAARMLLTANFGAMLATDDAVALPALRYTVECMGTAFSIARDGAQELLIGECSSDLLFMLEKDITVELQKRRSDLLFLHSAAVECDGYAYLLAAEAGRGKSTTTWALLHHGFRYLSDELSSIELDPLAVLPYPRALSLKRSPPAPYGLPEGAIDLGRTIHLPPSCLPDPPVSGRRAIGAVFLLRHYPGLEAAKLRELSIAEASARLYVTALNMLAHRNYGLDAVVRLAENTPCFALDSADLPSTCALIRSAVT